jgi:hypothetical protein
MVTLPVSCFLLSAIFLRLLLVPAFFLLVFFLLVFFAADLFSCPLATVLGWDVIGLSRRRGGGGLH